MHVVIQIFMFLSSFCEQFNYCLSLCCLVNFGTDQGPNSRADDGLRA